MLPADSSPLANRATATGAFSHLLPAEKVEMPEKMFLTPPYLQLGNVPQKTKTESLDLLWHVAEEPSTVAWSVETKPATSREWRDVPGAPAMRPVRVGGAEPHRVYRATLSNLTPGEVFDYRVLREGKPVFAARSKARTHADTFPFLVFGDCAANTDGQKQIARLAEQQAADFVFITGDIVYSRGRVTEYRTHFFPVYNPLLPTVPFIAAPGNHDVRARTEMDKYPDGMAYFYYWAQPLNGILSAKYTPTMTGQPEVKDAILQASGANYPRMANFSFDWGNTHWTVLDSNPYVNWSDGALRQWVENDLKSAQKATWRFVAFHHPPFNSSETHHDDQQMRALCDLFERYRVAIVWSGHVHNYQRTYPLTFRATGKRDKKGRIFGTWQLDKTFDGVAKTKTQGVIYIITGGGGASLYDKEQEPKPDTWEPFTQKYLASAHSLTSVQINGTMLTARQLTANGSEVDRFTLSAR
jgi:predicted MPP superfamily phosphohydrolase